MQFQIPDVKVMFYLPRMCMERVGGDMERRFWLAAAAAAGLRLLHRPRGSADNP